MSPLFVHFLNSLIFLSTSPTTRGILLYFCRYCSQFTYLWLD